MQDEAREGSSPAAGGASVGEPVRDRPAVKALAAVLLGFTALVASLALFEVGCQIYGRAVVFERFDEIKAKPRHYYRASDSPVLAYELRPDAHVLYRGRELAINRYGVREPDDDLARDRWRLAVLGDSVVFGVSHSEDRTISGLLQAELDPGGERVRVLNFGLGGLNLAEIVEYLRLKDAIYDVDEVIFLLNPNDYAPRESVYEGADNGLYRIYHRPTLYSPLFLRKAVYRFIKNGPSSVRWYRWMFWGNEEWGQAQLRKLAADTRKRGIPLHVVLYPVGVAYRDGKYRLAGEYAKIAAFLESEGIRILDPTEVFGREVETYYDPTDHLHDPGNVLMAREMAAFLRSADIARVPSRLAAGR